MVCKNCESKLSKLAAPDPSQSSSSSIKEGSRKVGDNKLSKGRFEPYRRPGDSGQCKVCKQQTTQNCAKYCHGCAYKRGRCSMCGKKILDTTGYMMSNK